MPAISIDKLTNSSRKHAFCSSRALSTPSHAYNWRLLLNEQHKKQLRQRLNRRKDTHTGKSQQSLGHLTAMAHHTVRQSTSL
jgi:hypothetical protein